MEDASNDVIARTNIPCVGLGYSGYWASQRELAQFMAHLPDRFSEYGSVYLRRSPNKFDGNGKA